MIYPLLLERELTTQRPEGGVIEMIEVVQREDRKWQINIRVSWKSDEIMTVGFHSTKRIKVYSYAYSALRHIVADYRYLGRISVLARSSEVPKSYF